MRDNPMCKGCVRLDAIGADPEIPCAVCGYPSSTDQTSESVDQSKISKAVEIARGYTVPPSEPIEYDGDDGWCWNCGGAGYHEDDCTCWEDTCCCLYPEPPVCDVCRGSGEIKPSRQDPDT